MSAEKRDNLSNQTGSCERVFTSIICCGCYQTSHDISDHEEHRVSGGGPNAVKKPPEIPSSEKGVTFSTDAVDHRKRPVLAKSDTFSEYIHRAKTKIRTMSNVGTTKNDSETAGGVHVHVHDPKKDGESKDGFTDYINRAKMKIRKTSSIGSKKSHSL